MKKFFIIITLLITIIPLFAETTYLSYEFELDDFTLSSQNNYNVITPPKGKQFILTSEVSKPQLPLKLINISIPTDKDISHITVTNSEFVQLEGTFLIYPSQKPKPLSAETPFIFVEPDKAVYSSKAYYPERIISLQKSGFLSGYHISSFTISPFQYEPTTGTLIFYTKIELQISYERSKDDVILPLMRSDITDKLLQHNLSKVVDNSIQLQKPSIVIINDTSGVSKDTMYEYLIITSSNLTEEFNELAEWKTQKGLNTLVLSTSYIYDNYDGEDNAAKIRNCIKDYYLNHGTLWVLLGGDTNQVAYREAFAFDCEYGQYWHNFIPCDLYFSDLDGTWNDNDNDVYGELEDNIDMYPDVFVGRASVENETEAAAFVSKILTYEKNPPLDYQDDMLFLASVLWNDPYTDSGQSKNLIDELYVPQQFDPITKLYQSMGNINYDDVMANLNAGKSIVNHCGHAWYSVMSLGNGHLNNSDMDALTNAPAFSIWYTIGCWPAAFDYNCIAEHWINNPCGGGVAFIGNSRYGWGSPGNPTFGYSDIFDQEFYNQLFQQDITSIGATLGMAKSVYVPFARNHNVFRWCEYQTNLLGEPEMPIWTDLPKELTVFHPLEVPPGDTDVAVRITYDGNPAEDVLVCLFEDGEILGKGFTNMQGIVTLSIVAGSSTEDIIITATKQNFIPYQSAITTVYEQPFVLIDSYATNNSLEGYVLPGTNVSMDAGFHNFGQLPSENISIILNADHNKITFVDSTHYISELLPKTGIFEDDVFSFTTSPELENGEILTIDYTITDDSDGIWQGVLPVTGAVPALEYVYHQVSDSTGGNSNGIPEPGENINVQLIVNNFGFVESYATYLNIDSPNPDVVIPSGVLSLGDIQAGHCEEVTFPVYISDACLPPIFPELICAFIDSLGFTSTDSFTLTIGNTGFSDDMESGETKWSHWGTHDLWHLTDYKALTGDYSWYCGIADTMHYPDNVEDYLQTIPFTTGKTARVNFWCCYEFTNYGVDGIYVEIYDGTEWQTLDFIGSGGALGVLTTKNDWLEYDYDISFIPEGVESQLRFRFVSDSEDVAEGIYIDDVTIFEDDNPIHVDFVASRFYGEEPISIDFINKSYATTGAIVSYEWNFGDGNTSDERNPTHIYTDDGLKTVTLKVIDQFGIESQIMKANYIHVLPDTTKTVYVNPDGSADFTTISEALDVLNTGDSIMIADGIYTGFLNTNLVIPKDNITIFSENGYQNCIIDGEGSAPAFMIGFHEGVHIEGITFSSCFHNGYGGAISTNGSVTIRNCLFEDCSSDYNGGAIWAVGGTSLEIDNCIFESCDADKGGALYIELYENISIVNSDFIFCQSNEFSGGAILMNMSNTALIQECNFDNCTVFTVGDGGGLYSQDIMELSLIETIFQSCSSPAYGGGIQCYEVVDAIIDSCSFFSNISGSGGGLSIHDSNVQITHSILRENEARTGAGCYLLDDALVWIDNSLFYSNNSSYYNSKGGAFYVNNATLAVMNSTIVNNEVVTQAGGISHLGSHQITIYNSILWNNEPVDIWSTDSTKINVSYSDITLPWNGEGNIAVDPSFVDTSSYDYYLQELSPCIDSGNNIYVQDLTDLDARVRIWDGAGIGEAIVDMGCYEYGAPIYTIDPEMPEQDVASLLKNFPNPFSTDTQIRFYLPARRKCSIVIYNIKGQKVSTVFSEEKEAGFHTATWDGKNYQNRDVANGIYFYVLNTGERKEVKKLVLMR
ncbi:MAG TPA: T9SS type A sorting domain-containing protein [Candidatus Cloacimonetes bacterium]|nr:T9SS type A sorting domain-containing protein [Candidatus Cloacimonadota bacterium]HEX37457.1 T9SS type A sorting domain-containing protein [Candidatus Cloacimonadota bacterium]